MRLFRVFSIGLALAISVQTLVALPARAVQSFRFGIGTSVLLFFPLNGLEYNGFYQNYSPNYAEVPYWVDELTVGANFSGGYATLNGQLPSYWEPDYQFGDGRLGAGSVTIPRFNLSTGDNLLTLNYSNNDGSTGTETFNLFRRSPTVPVCPTIDPDTHLITDLHQYEYWPDAFWLEPPYTDPASGNLHVDWSGCDLSHADLSAIPLGFRNSNLEGTNFADQTKLQIAAEYSNIRNTSFINTRFLSGTYNQPLDASKMNFKNVRGGYVTIRGQGSPADRLTPGTDIDFTGAAVSASLQQIDISGSILSSSLLAGQLSVAQVTARNVDFSNCSFSNSVYFYDVSGANFSGCRMVGTSFVVGSDSPSAVGTEFRGVNFANATLIAGRVEGADFTEANLTGATLAGGGPWNSFAGTNFTRANFTGAKIDDVDLSQTNLTNIRSGMVFSQGMKLPLGWKLINGYLVGPTADLSYSSLYERDLSGMNLAGARFNYADLAGANLSGSNLTGATMNFANLVSSNLTNATMVNAHLDYADLHASTLAGADMTGAFMFGANLTGAQFVTSTSTSPVSSASIGPLASASAARPADLTNASFANADLHNAVFEGSTLINSSFFGANLVGTTFTNALWASAICVDGTLSDTKANGTCTAAPVRTAGAPATPTTPAATPGANSITFSWAPVADNGSAIDNYVLTQASSATGPFSLSSGSCRGTTSLTCTITGLQNGSSYYFKLHAHNANGWSEPSAVTMAVVPRTVPGAPTEVSGSPGNNSATVSWLAPGSDGGSPVTSYTVSSSPGGFSCTTSTRTCTVTGLTNGNAYTFTVSATNAAGTGAASIASAPVVPVAPPTVTSIAPTSGGVGTSVVINGSNLLNTTSVVFSSGKSAPFTVLSNTQIVTAVPTGAVTGSIRVTSAGGSATTASFKVGNSLVVPTVTGYSPASLRPGMLPTGVVITGTNLAGATAVALNGSSLEFRVLSANSLRVSLPAGITSGPIRVTTAGGTSNNTIQVSVLQQPVRLSAGTSHSCAVVADGTVKCWGLNTNGRLGDGTTTQRTTPVLVAGISSGASDVAAGDAFTCAVVSGGVKCWGLNTSGQLGDGTTTQRITPVSVYASGTTAFSGATQVAAGAAFACALKTDGTVWCWGSDASGQLGNGTSTTTNQTRPVQVSGVSGATAIAAGGGSACAVVAGGVKCWGLNTNGQVGDGTTTPRTSPVDVKVSVSTSLSAATGVSVGAAHACALLSSGGVKCWGLNTSGQLGIGTSTGQSVFAVDVKVNATTLLSGVTQLAAGASHNCAIVGMGGSATARCWGLNTSGQLGDGTTTNRAFATSVAGSIGNGLSQLAAGGAHTISVVPSTVLPPIAGAAWGSNKNGQLGDSTTTNRTGPTSVLLL